MFYHDWLQHKVLSLHAKCHHQIWFLNMLNVNPWSSTPTFVNIIILNYQHSLPSPPSNSFICLVKIREKTNTIHINGLLLSYIRKKIQYLNSGKDKCYGKFTIVLVKKTSFFLCPNPEHISNSNLFAWKFAFSA